jgi:hypothetical protein
MKETCPIHKLSKDEFETLKKSGLLKKIYPDAPDTYEDLHPTKLQRLSEPNFTKVIANAESIVAQVEKDGYDREDDAHYLYEDVMEAVYGSGIWEYLKRLRKRGGLRK